MQLHLYLFDMANALRRYTHTVGARANYLCCKRNRITNENRITPRVALRNANRYRIVKFCLTGSLRWISVLRSMAVNGFDCPDKCRKLYLMFSYFSCTHHNASPPPQTHVPNQPQPPLSLSRFARTTKSKKICKSISS